MPPGGQSATRKPCRSSPKHADFSATRCFTIAIDGLSVDKAAAVEDDFSANADNGGNCTAAATARAHAAAATTATARSECTRRRSASQRVLTKDSTEEQKSLSSSRTSSLNSLSSADIAALGGVASFDAPVTAGGVKRQFFWRNVVKQFNFTDEHERQLLLSLTHGIEWMAMKVLPRAFMQRHREIFYLISTPEYQRSGSIQRDVTRTFSIFERSYLPDRDIGAQQGALFRVLNAIAEAEDGYCQGMNFVAALFLVEGLDEADAYALFLYLLKKRHLARIYQRSSTFLDDYLEHFDMMFQRELPDLHRHMRAQGFVIPMYGIEWFTTLFSLSTKPDLACAIFDLFFVGVPDIFLRVGLAILKLLESKLMCMGFEDFLKEFKPLVRQIDPYQAVLQALALRANPLVRGEDTTAHIARAHFLLSAHQSESSGQPAPPPKTFERHRTLPPQLTGAIISGDFAHVQQYWHALASCRASRAHCIVLANEILHFAVWYGRAALACFTLARCGADVNNVDDSNLTPLHFAAIRNQPDIVRVLLCYGADECALGGRWTGSPDGLTPLETAQNWRFRDTTAVQLVLEREVCLVCNTKIDRLAFGKETCAQCEFPFCDRPFANCFAKHQCPRVCGGAHAHSTGDDWDALDESASSGDETRCRFRNSSGALTVATTGSSSRCSSVSACEPPPLVESASANSIAKVEPLERRRRDDALRGGSDNNVSERKSSSGFFLYLAELFAAVPRDSQRATPAAPCERVRAALEFPDRPEWYCNAPTCHVVFAFFSHGLECACCGGFFCADDFCAKSKRCLRCERNR